MTGNFATFTVPAANTATTFTTSTSYFVVLTYDQQARPLMYHEAAIAEDGGASAAGWTITNAGLYKPAGPDHGQLTQFTIVPSS